MHSNIALANERTVAVDRVLAADVDGGGVWRDDGYVAECRTGDEPFGPDALDG
ncbi:hypothetical protein [Arthrobacter sp. NtRootA1]|uniref:hypothetical protein n=1 Tax=Arthrobacter sp. NtRootA1 TaxID=2830983 RepID=UPI001CC418DA|nr:hypothetical protein [Arthrobacter sp. NtRootA1]